MDIVVNHTADVIQYKECPESRCAYRGVADYPYTRQGGVAGAPINDGFDGKDFRKLKRTDWAYTPYVPVGQEHAKKPDWLNDPIYYHNRGDSTFAGESSLLGDFATLDDVFTENPRVVAGFIEVYGQWIDDFGVDGFRIDTARHVNPEFWQAFVPAMLARAKARASRTSTSSARCSIRTSRSWPVTPASTGCRPCWTSPSSRPRRTSP